MGDITNTAKFDSGMCELSIDEIDCVSGGFTNQEYAVASVTLAGGIGMATFGSTWGGLAVGAAFAAAPVAVIAMAGLAAYAGYQYFRK